MKLRVDTALTRIREHLPPAVYGMLVNILHWTDLMDRLNAGESVDLRDPATTGAMLAAFKGFGDPATWDTLRPSLTVMIMSEVLEWIAREKDERGELTPYMLLKLAPTLAAIAGRAELHGIVTDVIKRTMEES